MEQTTLTITTNSPEEATALIEILAEMNRPTGVQPTERSQLIKTAAYCLKRINAIDEKCKGNTSPVIPDFDDQPKGQGLFALFNHVSDRRFSQDAHVLPYNEHH
jgi:hypothetical protein